MAHPKSAHPAVLSPVTLSKKIEDYEPVAEFLSSCKSAYTAKGCKTALNKFFNFVAVEKKGFDPVAAIKMKPEQLPACLKVCHASKESCHQNRKSVVFPPELAFHRFFNRHISFLEDDY